MDCVSKETACTKCIHRDVCRYKEDFLAAQKAADMLFVDLPAPNDGEVHGRGVHLYSMDYIEPIELRCKKAEYRAEKYIPFESTCTPASSTHGGDRL